MEFASLAAVFIVLISVSINVKGKLSCKSGCDIFDGKWVSDDSYPYYESSQCPFIEGQFDCRKKGRPDNGYTKYRWQPSGGCTLPRFNAVDFLKKMKGKRLMFVGDSLSVNQWQSLTCMLHAAVPEARYISERIQGLSNFTFPDYNVSVMLFRNAFLVDRVNETIGRVMWLDSINSSQIWGQMDVIIFDSWHWWFHVGRKQPWDWIVYGNTIVKDMDRLSAYEKALNTWAKWIDSNVDPTKTQVFFQGVSPDHNGGSKTDAKSCEGQTKPLQRPGSPHPGEVILEKVLKAMVKPVYLLNITTLSQLRIDGHPSIYTRKPNKITDYKDCTHWCLSGVPDTWNEMLYALLN